MGVDRSDLVYQKWLGWFERIKSETHGMWLYRHLWDGLVEITGPGHLPASVIFDALGSWYSAYQVVSVRRQLDLDDRAISLARLLQDVQDHPGVITRERYVGLFGEDPLMRRRGEHGFDELAGHGESSMSSAIPGSDLADLQEAGAPVAHYVNRVVAHHDQRGARAVPTFGELNHAIDTVGALVKKYAVVLRAETIWQLVPELQEDWRAPFRMPWMRAEDG